MKIAVTGANGNVGRQVLSELLTHHYEVRALTLAPWEECPDDVEPMQVDVKNFDQVKNGLAGCDAVIHLAAYPSPHGPSESEVFANNVMGVYHVLLAAGELGIRRAACASSDCAYGITYSHKDTRPIYVPVDEEHPSAPDNCYGMSKLAGEQVAEGMAKRFDLTVASLRFTYVIRPGNYAQSEFSRSTGDPELGPWNVWSYIDGRDCARAFRLAIERPFTGHQVFNIAAAEQRTTVPTAELVSKYYPDAEIRKPLDGFRSLLDCTKAAELLGFVPEYRWRDFVR
ncbi:NAD(P)-dependent oxidoreductase [Paenibacillus sp. H1-7]|uniref:NAD-dependent epimerase/dehydratase family protein n=1 Tax=Paenibacillus sp. H1-7 TaxID=2282849 RepID=UPI001EF825C1|nr:NAD(P)-dependent oxidoreductase [Paenibacillus sp. H1-7]ULL15223.1 NAD(P)-dependent oxidoreductase [Paenibacillus sp. H1-7]